MDNIGIYSHSSSPVKSPKLKIKVNSNIQYELDTDQLSIDIVF